MDNGPEKPREGSAKTKAVQPGRDAERRVIYEAGQPSASMRPCSEDQLPVGTDHKCHRFSIPQQSFHQASQTEDHLPVSAEFVGTLIDSPSCESRNTRSLAG